jgi:hypothetical protein
MTPHPSGQPLPWHRHLVGFALACLLAAAWGSVVQTQINLQALKDLGVPVPAGLRLQTTLQDLGGFAPVYGGILAAGWLPAFAVAAWLARRQPTWRGPLMSLAGAAGMVAAVRAVDAVAPMPVFIDATRDLAGLSSMAAGCLLGGALYARWTRRA